MPGSAPDRGALFAIGGREARSGDAAVLGHFVSLCGGPAARLVVLTTASRDPQKRVREYREAFRSLGVEQLSFFHQDRRGEAEDPALLAAVDRADGVFFAGGGQLKLVTTLGGTALESRLRERHCAGLHLGGTSAGAAAMSAVMIARGQGRSSARLSSVRMSPGLGFLPRVIVDQHFRERDRFGRLLAAVLCNPSMLGFGLDEDTAFLLDPRDRVSVFGSGTLTIIDGSDLEESNVDRLPEDAPVAFAGMRMHVLSEGWSYDLAEGRVQAPATEPVERRPVVETLARPRAQGDQG
ncbi:MAG: cyanophycinase [Deltaproteobacteria bacterium]|nr:cyanophycinase [Deltaproteobacteria bacterium]